MASTIAPFRAEIKRDGEYHREAIWISGGCAPYVFRVYHEGEFRGVHKHNGFIFVVDDDGQHIPVRIIPQ